MSKQSPKVVAIVIDWSGPYTIEEARESAKKDFDQGLYMLIGKVRNQKKTSKIQYIGIAKDLYTRIGNGHHKISELSQECYIWLGEVASFGVPGAKKKIIDRQLDLAEWLHAYFLKLPLNKKKGVNPPDSAATVLNRWWSKGYKKLKYGRPHEDWPDLIDFLGKEFGAKIAWFGRKLVRRTPDEF